MRWVKAQRLRLRKRARQTIRRSVGRHANERWTEKEIAKALPVFVPAIVSSLAGYGRTWWADILFFAGSAIFGAWMIFVLWQNISVGARQGDKVYHQITKRHLSEEYQDKL